MSLCLMYITNRQDVAQIAQKYGVDRIWVDLETRGKEERQKNYDSVKSHHSVADIKAIKPHLTTSEMLVRVNPWYDGSTAEINSVIDAGADIIMLPYWKTSEEVSNFVNAVNGRCKTTLLLETKEALECVDEVLAQGGFDEIHIGLNDLHLSYGMTFMFELLSDGTVEKLCNKFKAARIPYGFGGIAKLGSGMLPAEKVIMEHYRLGSTRAILSRSFCDCARITDIAEIERTFSENLKTLRAFESSLADKTPEDFAKNKAEVATAVDAIVEHLKFAKKNAVA
ncbi:aldolase/citrate lyase family protein [Fibrobacter sp. UBA4297]|uniref:aldolase/citrate lyase family protein n=1 Tax=Fibrobacter sp. UBA4297 TaxID=1946536 RepID=UPI0025C125D2|nr:aldolase/citrate lyase family protein [Fibrobacter sp. UBA4297]